MPASSLQPHQLARNRVELCQDVRVTYAPRRARRQFTYRVCSSVRERAGQVAVGMLGCHTETFEVTGTWPAEQCC